LKEYTPGRISFFVSVALILLMAVFFVVASLMSSTGYTQRVNALNSERIQSVFESEAKEPFVMIIDAGHGGEDPGAVVGGISEKDINLAISRKLRDFAALSDCEIVMTRTEDKMLYGTGEENRKKFYDLYNRLECTKKHSKSVLISIHQNKFPMESCRGTQVFYGLKNENSVLLAKAIQNAALLIQPDNNRVVKPGNNIYLLENSDVPSVIVECGFISNPDDARLLTDDEYTDKLAFLLYRGIAEYLEEVNSEN